MLLEGPEWRRRCTELIPESNRGVVERIGAGVYRSVGGFVTGNLVASLLAGLVATIIMLVTGVPYAVPLGLFVAIIELVPYVGPLVATVVVTAVALTVGPRRRSSRWGSCSLTTSSRATRCVRSSTGAR